MANKNNRWAPVITIVVLLVALLAVNYIKSCNNSTVDNNNNKEEQTTNARGLNRNPSKINYSKHAQCRMDCRHIDEREVAYILANGKINYTKSEIGNNPDCKKKYAVEGITQDKQKVRIIFAPCKTEVTVVTVIDLDTEWTCDCK
ncbi:DUF4258 domain-containing protein [Polluticaenibacter yanchengensis]|uniref:DUF4258 domain-containing protein n=1 Tax=Polluticaenibacter yanchengensis TaxID=3014562 RepID=A0ABT4UF36_9BACT|nr:DUF4258 domain-containing protein [Chitinophagaceae bacterium LY-5]